MRGKKGKTVKDASSAVPLFAFFPSSSTSRAQIRLLSSTEGMPVDTHYAFTHTLSSSQTIQNLRNVCPFSPLTTHRQETWTPTPCKYAHTYTLLIVINDPLKAGLTSWDHFYCYSSFFGPSHFFINLFLLPLAPQTHPHTFCFLHCHWCTFSHCELFSVSRSC